MRRTNNTVIILVLLGLLALLGYYCVYGKKSSENYKDAQTMEGDDLELLAPADTPDAPVEDVVIDDQFELMGVAPEEPAFEIGFGMGPGVYGSGRHMSEFVGN